MNTLRLAGVLLFAFMGVAVDFSSYLLSVISDALFISALVFIVWSPLMTGVEKK
ncbi:DUF3927 domain-containing protein [Pectobacterium parmentieri]|uniref:DUF3927 domain-containing protein n=1 Tax=Pectobacterium parmentieri TaxID=1905730 RepID=A0A8B3F7E1_PECPM|nr:DUF3927 domain-containing protein [Pectobacterium parmentieri]AYH09703.1 DUF3927 domain-containing protein [Pectobacterium parmentieri]AYH19588.1 DUF3927 domain-containing protein [Pectobacterium parmentieri]AZS56084.1 DUF3927 domain-containing protein [Pectobacterium parmentieri]RKO75709.1 DUF3927 domain-containing protein [Pectobacterium parmentieri]